MTSNSLAGGKIGAQKVEGTCKAIALHYTSKGGRLAAESQRRQTGRCRREERSQQCLSSQPREFSNCHRQWETTARRRVRSPLRNQISGRNVPPPSNTGQDKLRRTSPEILPLRRRNGAVTTVFATRG
ncbi:hypothetical protein Bbelb_038540 [Branchiostoma belcheri]|nr:hypothetical protein Bbelb_038540 [Branchiostoma belcheri]